MRGRTRTHNGVNAIIRGHQERDCLNKYSKLKEEIEYRITQLTKNHDSVFCRKCSGIKQDIFKKNADLDYCYRNNLLRHKLHEDSALSEFINNCSGSSNCRKPTAVPKKPVALTNPKDVSCRKGSKGCNQSPAQPKTEEDKSQPRVNAETSKIIGSEGSASVKQGQEQDDGGKSRSAKIQAKPRTAPSHSPVGTHVEASQQLDNKHNTPSEEAVTQLQELSQGAPYTGSNLGDTSSDPSDQLNSQGDSEVNCTPQGTNLDTKCIQKNSSSIKNLDGNLSGEQTTIDGIAGRKDGSQVVTTSENPDDRSTSGQIDGDEKANAVGDPGGDDNNKSPVILPDPKECSNPGTTTCENGGSKRSGDRTNNSEASAEVASSRSHTDTHTENTSDSHTSSGSTGAGNDSDDSPNTVHLLKSVDEEKQHGQETAHAEVVSYKSDKPTNNPQLHQSDASFVLTYLPSPSGQNLLESSQENHGGTLGRSSSATAEVTEEIVKYENVLGILSQFFNKIPHKDYIMMGFIPMAFIPLLILLMKYTPLRAIFAKKKKKKRNDMNEKLQRVLFEPSNGSEEKRIPFSYSAFEYSS